MNLTDFLRSRISEEVNDEWYPDAILAPNCDDAALRLLASHYADHPDYDEDWRP